MEPLYAGRVHIRVGDSDRGTWALPAWENVAAGRLPGAGLHLPHSWIPTRLCRFMPYELGWLVQLGRARARVDNKYLGGAVFAPRTVVALQPGRSLVSFPELDDAVMIAVTIGAGQAEGLTVARDQDHEIDQERRTSYAVGRVELSESDRRVLAVAFEHLMSSKPPPANVAAAAAGKLADKSEQAVKNVFVRVMKKVNRERWLDLRTTEQLGHYLVDLSRNLTSDDLPPVLRDT